MKRSSILALLASGLLALAGCFGGACPEEATRYKAYLPFVARVEIEAISTALESGGWVREDASNQSLGATHAPMTEGGDPASVTIQVFEPAENSAGTTVTILSHGRGVSEADAEAELKAFVANVRELLRPLVGEPVAETYGAGASPC